jgi:hypothetical protein
MQEETNVQVREPAAHAIPSPEERKDENIGKKSN